MRRTQTFLPRLQNNSTFKYDKIINYNAIILQINNRNENAGTALVNNGITQLFQCNTYVLMDTWQKQNKVFIHADKFWKCPQTIILKYSKASRTATFFFFLVALSFLGWIQFTYR